MPIERRFFDWSKPALPQAAQWLIDTFSTDAGPKSSNEAASRVADLSGLVVCVPGAQARRRLIELLVEYAAAQKSLLTPPRIITPGPLPELLYHPKRPFATVLAQQLAWVRVLKETKPDRLSPLVRNWPRHDDLPGWLALGKMLADLHHELAADRFNFDSALTEMKRFQTFNEPERWVLLGDLQRRYLTLLDSLMTWDKQTARLFAIEHHECQLTATLILVGLVDLNRTQRKMLDQVADRVTALVFAPVREARSGRDIEEFFDEHGCLRCEAWQDFTLPISDDQIEVAAGPTQQADAVVLQLAKLNGKYDADDIVVGVPDARLAPFIEQRLAEAGAAARYAAGAPLTRTSPYQLLSLAADYVEFRRFRDLAALVRHPAVSRWLINANSRLGIQTDCLSLFDRFHAAHLPAFVTDQWPETGGRLDEMRRIQGVIAALLTDLAKPPQPLEHWAQSAIDLLATVYGDRPLDERVEHDRKILLACQSFRDAAVEFAEIDGKLSPEVAGPAAVRLMLRQLESEAVPAASEKAAIELVGWLDLPWNDAPVAIVTGMNEGRVSPALGGDLFLPNAVRRELQLTDNNQYFARDLYALGLLAASKEHLHLIAGRRSVEKEPLAPSRLLFACDDPQLARRTNRLFAAPADSKPMDLWQSVRPGRAATVLPVPLPQPLPAPVISLRVTEFKDYLACPYRYYLRHRLGLVAMVDSAAELDGGAFGSLLHEALHDFYESPAVDSDNPAEIKVELSEALGKLAANTYGTRAHPAVQVQVALARERLVVFAERQAKWRQEGWKIHAVEKNIVDGEAAFDVDGSPISLRGRIDRIDFNERTGHWAVLDYKSSEAPKSPDVVHRRKGTWIDLQLPLYRYLAKALKLEGPVDLGYILLPKDVGHCRFEMAGWTPEELAQADAAAVAVVRAIREGRYHPPTAPPPDFFGEFSAICQDGGFSATALGALDTDEAAS